MADTFDKGDLVRVTGAFKNSAGSLIDPTGVVFKYKNGASGTVTTLTYPTDVALVKDSTGNYHVDINASAEGVWYWRWESTGMGQAAGEGEFFAKSAF